jgi:hypothetical protein
MHAWPVSSHRSVLVLRGGARDQAPPARRHARRSLTSAMAKSRSLGAAEAENDETSESSGESRSKQSRGATTGDLVDIDAKTGAEIRRRARGRGRSLAGYTLQENGDWVRLVGSLDQQATLSPFLAPKRAADAPHERSDPSDTDPIGAMDASSPSSQAPEGADSTRIADQILSGMGSLAHLEVPPLDESLWTDLPTKWVVFSDLHVSRSSLRTCLEVLDRVHKEAKKRDAGVIFLGDFWHEKGVLRVESLNSVLLALRQWRLPLIALPGNLNPKPKPRTPNSEPRTPNHEPRTTNHEPRTPNPEPRTPETKLNPER